MFFRKNHNEQLYSQVGGRGIGIAELGRFSGTWLFERTVLSLILATWLGVSGSSNRWLLGVTHYSTELLHSCFSSPSTEVPVQV